MPVLDGVGVWGSVSVGELEALRPEGLGLRVEKEADRERESEELPEAEGLATAESVWLEEALGVREGVQALEGLGLQERDAEAALGVAVRDREADWEKLLEGDLSVSVGDEKVRDCVDCEAEVDLLGVSVAVQEGVGETWGVTVLVALGLSEGEAGDGEMMPVGLVVHVELKEDVGLMETGKVGLKVNVGVGEHGALGVAGDSEMDTAHVGEAEIVGEGDRENEAVLDRDAVNVEPEAVGVGVSLQVKEEERVGLRAAVGEKVVVGLLLKDHEPVGVAVMLRRPERVVVGDSEEDADKVEREGVRLGLQLGGEGVARAVGGDGVGLEETVAVSVAVAKTAVGECVSVGDRRLVEEKVWEELRLLVPVSVPETWPEPEGEGERGLRDQLPVRDSVDKLPVTDSDADVDSEGEAAAVRVGVAVMGCVREGEAERLRVLRVRVPETEREADREPVCTSVGDSVQVGGGRDAEGDSLQL